MKDRCLIASLLCMMLWAGCHDDPVQSSVEPSVDPKPVPGPGPVLVDPNAPQPITLGIGGMGLQNTITTRGYGVVGSLREDSLNNVWHSEQLYIYGVNRFATNLQEQFVDADHEIPTFLKGGWLQQTPVKEGATPWGGDPAMAPFEAQSGLAEFDDSLAVYKYYPLNGAYNFMGYHIDDAKVLSSGLVDDDSAIEIKLELDGTQDIMIGNAKLTSLDTIRFIQSLITSEKLDSADIKTYYDAENHQFSPLLSLEQLNVIEKELKERHYSSYSNRRDIKPQMNFEHQLSRITFQVVGGNSDAVVRLSNRPKIRFTEWTRRRYWPGEMFTHRGEIFFVKQDTQDALYEEELFDNERNKSRFLKSLNFSLNKPMHMGDTIVYKNELYRFLRDYDGKAPTWEKLEPYMNNITSGQLQYQPGRSYFRGECVVSPNDSCWIVEKDVPNADTWQQLRENSIPFQQGVFISKIVLKDVNNHATLKLTPKELSFIPSSDPADSTTNYVLKQRPSQNFQYGDSLVELEPVGPAFTLAQYGQDDQKATRVGESMMVMPGVQEYLADIYVTEYVDMYGNLVDDDMILLDDHRTKVYYDTRIRPTNQDGSEVFEPGCSYMITITAYALQGVEVNTNLVAWNPGGTTDIDPEDQLFNGIQTIAMPVAYYGVLDTIPTLDFQIRTGKDWSPSGPTKDTISYEAKGVRWFALREEFQLQSFVNEGNNRDYMDAKFNQLIKTDLTYKFTINITSTYKKEYNYRLYYTTDDEGNPVTDGNRKFIVKVKETAPK